MTLTLGANKKYVVLIVVAFILLAVFIYWFFQNHPAVRKGVGHPIVAPEFSSDVLQALTPPPNAKPIIYSPAMQQALDKAATQPAGH